MRTPVSRLLDSLDITPERILDVGSGHGGSTKILQRRFPHSQIISLDIMEDLCKYVSKNVNPDVICADATNLPLQDKCFDLVVCDNIIEHVEDQDKLVEELGRDLTDEGYIIWGSVLRKRFALAFRRNERGDFVIDPGHIREYKSREEFERVLKPHFRTVCLSVSPAFTSLPIDLYRFGVRIGLVKSSQNHIKYNPFFESRSLFQNIIQKLIANMIIPRFGYQDICLIAKKRLTA